MAGRQGTGRVDLFRIGGLSSGDEGRGGDGSGSESSGSFAPFRSLTVEDALCGNDCFEIPLVGDLPAAFVREAHA